MYFDFIYLLKFFFFQKSKKNHKIDAAQGSAGILFLHFNSCMSQIISLVYKNEIMSANNINSLFIFFNYNRNSKIIHQPKPENKMPKKCISHLLYFF